MNLVLICEFKKLPTSGHSDLQVQKKNTSNDSTGEVGHSRIRSLCEPIKSSLTQRKNEDKRRDKPLMWCHCSEYITNEEIIAFLSEINVAPKLGV